MRFPSVIILVVIFNICGLAQKSETPAILDGTWLLSTKDSVTFGTVDSGLILEILSDTEKVTITRKYQRSGGEVGYKLVLFWDARGENNSEPWPGLSQPIVIPSSTNFKKNKLVRKYRVENPRLAGITRGTDTYYLSNDGTKLVLQGETMGEFAKSLETKGYSRVGETLSDVNRGSETNRTTKLVFFRKN